MNPQAPTQQTAADPRQQVLAQLKTSTDVLVTVSANPTVDQLAAAIGMTLLLNKLGKHATAVFSGQIPSTIEFLQPEKTLEKNTDSLRDFIIALDKSKADKLRYKIEDKFVKIFITPYHTSLTNKDLEFSQGDYNVDTVLTLGVKKREELDQTIMAHGRILHDATVIGVNNLPGADLGAINWTQASASGLSEMMVSLSEDLKTDQPKLLDQQIATCFLTGIVSQTARFSNAKTSPQTMSLAAKLMNAGANQQLIATKLEPPIPIPKIPEKINKPIEPAKQTAPLPPSAVKTPVIPVAPSPPIKPVSTAQPPAGPPKVVDKPEDKPKEEETQDGALLIPHEGIDGGSVSYQNGPEENISRINIDDQGTLKRIAEAEAEAAQAAETAQDKANQDTSLNHKMISQPPSMGGELSAADRPQSQAVTTTDLMSLSDVKGLTLSHNMSSANPQSPAENQTLSDLEQSVHSPHVKNVVDGANLAVQPLPANLIGPDKGLDQDSTAGSANPTSPPPVPPPLPMKPPPQFAPGNMSDPNAGVAL